MSIYNDYSNIKKITEVLKRYFKDRIKSTYTYRDFLKIDTITFDEYFEKLKNRELTCEDNLKLRLNDLEIDNLLKYIDYYFKGSFNINNNSCSDYNFLLDVLNNVKNIFDFDSEEIKEIYKYLICLDNLDGELIHRDFVGYFSYSSNNYLKVTDNNSNTFIEYSKSMRHNLIRDYCPIYFIDSLLILDNENYNDTCVYNDSLYYFDAINRCLYSKNFNAINLRKYLKDNNAEFLIKEYYKNSDDIKQLMDNLKKYKEFCNINMKNANDWALKLLSECADNDYTKEQEDMFVNILSSEILKELFINDSYIFMCDDRIENSPITDASIESSIPLKEGAISFEVIDNKAIIERGYKALQKIYY